MYSIIELIIAILTALIGEGLVIFLYPKLFRRQKVAETKQKERESDSVLVNSASEFTNSLLSTIESGKQMIREKEEIIKEKDDKIDELHDKIEALKDKINVLENRKLLLAQGLCLHYGCNIRRPERGQGDKFVEEHEQEDSIGADFLTIEELLDQRKNK